MDGLRINNAVSANIPKSITGIMAVIIILAIILTSVVFKKKLKEKFYSYTNIALIALLIFLSIFLVVDLLYIYTFSYVGASISVKELITLYMMFPQKFAYFALTIVAVICFGIFISNIVLIKKEGFHLYNLLGVVLGLLFMGIALGIEILNYSMEYVSNTYILEEVFNYFGIITSIIYVFLLTLFCYLECIYFGTMIMAYFAVKHKAAYDKDYVIILGCSIDKKGSLRPLLKARTNRAIHFAWEQEIATGKSVKFVPSGGKGTNEIISEASAMELYLLSHAAEEYEIIPEKQSTNTDENFTNSAQIIKGLNPNARVAFATTNYHILRSGILARYAGLDAEGVPSKTKWYFWPNGFIREFTAIILMKLKIHIKIAIVIFIISCILGIIQYKL